MEKEGKRGMEGMGRRLVRYVGPILILLDSFRGLMLMPNDGPLPSVDW